HDRFLNQLASIGVPGLLAFLAVLAAAARLAVRGWRRWRATDGVPAQQNRMLLGAVAASAVAYLLQASFNVQQVGLGATFWLLLGMLCVLAGAAPATAPAGARRRSVPWVAIGGAAVVVLVAAWFAIRPY